MLQQYLQQQTHSHMNSMISENDLDKIDNIPHIKTLSEHRESSLTVGRRLSQKVFSSI